MGERMPGKRQLLQKKISLSAILLALISVSLAIGLSYTICSQLIRRRADELDAMLLQTAGERTNYYLGEIAEVLNLAVSSSDLDKLLAFQQGAQNVNIYENIMAQANYTKYLRTMTLSYDNVDNFFYLSGDTCLMVHEDVGEGYEAQIRRFCTRLEESPAPGQFYLLNLQMQSGRNKSIAILRPIAREGAARGYIIAVLSESFAGRLHFAGDQLYLEDQAGNHAYLVGKPSGAGQAGRTLEHALAFPGWKLLYLSQGDGIAREFLQSLWLFSGAGLFYLALAAAAAALFGRRTVRPLREMQASMKGLAAGGKQGILFKRRRMHFKHRLMLFYTLLVVIPTIAFSAGFYMAAQGLCDQRLGYFFEHRTNFLFDQLDLVLQKYQRTIRELAYQQDVQEMMGSPTENRNELEGSVGRILLQKQTQNQGIMNIALYDGEGELRYSSFYSRHFMDERYDAALHQLQENPYTPYWGMPHPSSLNKTGLTLGLTIFSMPPNRNVGQKIGYLLLDFDTASLSSMIQDFERQGKARFSLFDKEGEPVLLGQARQLPGQGDSPGNVRFTHQLAGSGWQAAAEVPRQEYLLERMWLIAGCLCILTLLLILCFFFSGFSAVAVSRNVEVLLRFVRRLENPLGGERFQEGACDEIGELGNSFNEMLDRIEALTRRQLVAEMEIKNAQLTAKQFELNLLQSQINPHFLYNTLKTVQYMVHVQDPRAERMVRLLIHLFRTGISKGERLVTVQEEMRHVTTYLEIQQIRFSDKFQVDIQMEPGTEKLCLLKLTLQPIVENAIYHGLELLDRPGILHIQLKAQEGLTVCIEDNGNGMPPEKLEAIRQQLGEGGQAQSIGLFNVHERIRLFFGPEYGVSVESRLHEGTRVILRFPRREQPDCPDV